MSGEGHLSRDEGGRHPRQKARAQVQEWLAAESF